MKKTDRIYKFIGQAVIYTGIWASMTGLLIFGFLRNTIY